MSGLRLNHVNVTRGPRVLVKDLCLNLRPGEVWALLGRNGAGKTSLLHGLADLAPLAGELALDGHNLALMHGGDRARRVGLLLQDPEAAFGIPVAEAVLAGRFPWHGAWRGPDAEDRRLAAAAMTALELDALASRPLDRLSGGERRRVQLAALLAQDPALWLLDEPMNHLDWRWQLEALCLLTGRAQAGRCVLIALHDLNLAERLCSHALLLNGDGSWQAGPLTEVLSEATASSLYGLPLARDSGPHGAFWHPGQRR